MDLEARSPCPPTVSLLILFRGRYNFVEHFFTKDDFDVYVSRLVRASSWLPRVFQPTRLDGARDSASCSMCSSALSLQSRSRLVPFAQSKSSFVAVTSPPRAGGSAGAARVGGPERDLPPPLSGPPCRMGEQVRARRARRVRRRVRRSCAENRRGSACQEGAGRARR